MSSNVTSISPGSRARTAMLAAKAADTLAQLANTVKCPARRAYYQQRATTLAAKARALAAS